MIANAFGKYYSDITEDDRTLLVEIANTYFEERPKLSRAFQNYTNFFTDSTFSFAADEAVRCQC